MLAFAVHRVVLRALVDADITLVERWLREAHVSRWYERPEEWLHEIRARHQEFSFIRHLIACDGDTPVGFCQYYRCEDGKEPEYRPYWPQDAHSIDYLIGERAYLGRGVGRQLVHSLVTLVFAQTAAQVIVAQPDLDNAKSRGTLVANGFAHDAARDVFVRSWPLLAPENV